MADLQVVPADSLESFKAQQQKKKALLKETVAQRASECGVLLVRVDNVETDSKGSTLSKRQKQWLNSATHDSTTQNPVSYKYTKQLSKPSQDVLESEQARSVVQNLSDSLWTQPPGPSGIAKRIKIRRKERHQQLIRDMEEELAVISSEIEPKIKSASDIVHSHLAVSDKAITDLFLRMSAPEVLQDLNMSDLEQMWTEIAHQSEVKEECIKQLETTLHALETDRTQMIKKVLLNYSEQFKMAAYLLPEDVERLIEAQGLSANMAVIANKRNNIELCTHMRTVDCLHERQNHKKWLDLIEDWRHLLLKNAITSFNQFMEAREITSPSEMGKLKEDLTDAQKKAGLKRKALMEQILELKPPVISPALVYEWREEADKLYENLDEVHNSSLLKLQQCLDSAHRLCEDEMERLRKHLNNSGAFDSYTAYELMCKDFLPLIDEHSSKMREDLQDLEKSLDMVISTQKEHFSEVFQFVQEAALLWDNQKNAIAKIQRGYQEGLEKTRAQHDAENQNMEANLDVVLDRLRQGGSHEALKQYLSESLKMLNTIQASYSTFQKNMIREAKKLPSFLEPELEFYDSALCHHLGVARPNLKPSQSKSRVSKKATKINSPTRPQSKKSKGVPASTSLSKLIITVHHPGTRRTSEGGEEEGEGDGVEEESVVFFVQDESKIDKTNLPRKKSKKSDSLIGETTLTRRKSRKSETGIFLTQDEEMESTHVTLATENLVLAGGAFADWKQSIRVNFLEHLEHWKRECMQLAQQTVIEKEEEAKTELDLRLHLHQPRPSRVTEDIYDVRSVELTVHSERMTRHINGVVTSIHQHKNTIQTLTEDLKKMSEAFAKSMIAVKFSPIENGRQLTKLKNTTDKVVKKHMAAIDTTASEFRIVSEARLQEIIESNENYKASFRLFQDGGNYCQDEVEYFAKKMERIYAKIASTRMAITKESSNLVRAHHQMATDMANQFEENYEVYLADITFSEAISQSLVSVQVGIKSEVAASNSQAKKIFEDSDNIQGLLSDVIDKKIEATSIQDELSKMPTLLCKRAEYLYCCDSLVVKGPEDEDWSRAIRRSTDESASKGPISAVNVSKNILEASRRKHSIGEHPDQMKTDSKTGTPAKVLKEATSPDEPSSGTAATRYRTPRIRRKQSLLEKNREFVNNLGTSGGGSRLGSLAPKIRDLLKAKFCEFLERADEYYSNRSQGKDYDGNPLPHSSTVKDTLDECMEELEHKLLAYYSQLLEYRLDCIEEFQGQLKTLVPILQEYVILAYQEFGENQQMEARNTWQKEKTQLFEILKESHQERSSHESSLQPALGRPDREKELGQLCSHEEQRHTAALKLIADRTNDMREKQKKSIFSFLVELTRTARSLLLLVDVFIYPVEIIDFKPKAKPTTEDLLRLSAENSSKRCRSGSSKGAATKASATKASAKRKKIKAKVITSRTLQWPQLPQKLSLSPHMPAKKAKVNAISELMKEKPISKKTTIVHEETIRSRDLVFEEWMMLNEEILRDITLLEVREQEAEEKWLEHWKTSVENVQKLYTFGN